jgi:choline monooxygenase
MNTDGPRLKREVERFDPTIPIEAAQTPPAAWYRDPGIYELERRAVFAKNWLAVGREDALPTAGSYLAGQSLGRPYVVVRLANGELRAYHGACRHHAALLLQGEGCLTEITCPYHGWVYGLDGGLLKAPGMGGATGFDRAAMGLVPLAMACWAGYVFVHFGPDPRDLAADLQPLAAQLGTLAPPRPLRFVASRTYSMRCNWKVYVDNYLDGGYHIATAHPGLAAHLDLSSYRTELSERFNVQSCDSGGSSRTGAGALYAWVHPNLMLNRYGAALDVNIVRPMGPESSEVQFDFWFDDAAEPDVEQSIAVSEAIQREDVELSERVQTGLGSPAYDRGRYAPRKEIGEHHFHGLLAAELRAGLDDKGADDNDGDGRQCLNDCAPDPG